MLSSCGVIWLNPKSGWTAFIARSAASLIASCCSMNSSTASPSPPWRMNSRSCSSLRLRRVRGLAAWTAAPTVSNSCALALVNALAKALSADTSALSWSRLALVNVANGPDWLLACRVRSAIASSSASFSERRWGTAPHWQIIIGSQWWYGQG